MTPEQQEAEELKDRITEAEQEAAEARVEADEATASAESMTGALKDLAADRHERLCTYGQPFHCCPDELCMEANRALQGVA